MKAGNNKKYSSLGKSFLAVGLMLLLLFLTSINFFVYSSGQEQAELVLNTGAEEDSSPCSPSGPDEKPPANPISVNEEYLHGHDEISDPFLINKLFVHMVTASEKIELVHFELLSPPPEA
jgi:hypothetical protein